MIAFLLSLAICPPNMVAIEAGPAVFGLERPTERWHERSVQRPLGDYCIDRYEHPDEEGALPTVFVSWSEASEACLAEGKRLCTSDEWERACRGPEGRIYSYGVDFDRDACNTPIVGSGPGPGGIPYARAGSHPRCRSPEGVFDLNGNVSEWVADPWDVAVLGPSGGPGDDPATLRQLRGGTMWGGTFYGQSCVSRHGHPAAAQPSDDGFRCCATPATPPGTRTPWAVLAALMIALALALALGGLGRRLGSRGGGT